MARPPQPGTSGSTARSRSDKSARTPAKPYSCWRRCSPQPARRACALLSEVAQAEGGLDFVGRLRGHFAGLVGAFLEYLHDVATVLGQLFATRADRRDQLLQHHFQALLDDAVAKAAAHVMRFHFGQRILLGIEGIQVDK